MAKKVAPATKRRSEEAPAKKGRLAVREGETPWTAKEIAEVRATLDHDAERLQAEITAAETEINQLLREGGEGAGNDQADVGSNTFERDHEMSMAKNARENLELVHAAIQRIDEGIVRHLRVLWGADRQDAVAGVPACDTVHAMQTTPGTSLTDARSTRDDGVRPEIVLWVTVALTAFVLDQATKWWAEDAWPTASPGRSSASSCSSGWCTTQARPSALARATPSC